MQYPIMFSIGDRPFTVVYDTFEHEESADCIICDNTRSVTLKGEQFVCPECEGGLTIVDFSNIRVIQLEPIVSMYLRIDDEDQSHNMYEYHIGENAVPYDEDVLYVTREEAERAADDLETYGRLIEHEPYQFTKFIDVKYEVNQPVFVLHHVDHVLAKIPCHICGGDGKIIIKNKQFECMNCSNGYNTNYIGYKEDVLESKIVRITVWITATSQVEDYSTDDYNVIGPDDIFLTREEAEVECANRNLKLMRKLIELGDVGNEIS